MFGGEVVRTAFWKRGIATLEIEQMSGDWETHSIFGRHVLLRWRAACAQPGEVANLGILKIVQNSQDSMMNDESSTGGRRKSLLVLVVLQKGETLTAG